jgi:hypothetical protein
LTGDKLRFFVKKVEVTQTITNTVKGTTTTFKLDVAEDIATGSYYLYKTETNSRAQIFNDTTENAKIRVEVLNCAYFDADPTYGMCNSAWVNMFAGV